uniref:DUF7808 domain-containing protein n=1 Tax=Acrobeloides nanus TaxID=290746 RepID=A0A914E4W6_9BILA
MTSDDFPLTITDNGCFMEKDPNYHQLRNFCPLQCHNADFAYVIAIRPAQNHSCIEKETYNVARRRHDWFLWRSNDCLTEEVQFDIGCVTSSYVTTKGPINYQSSLESSNSQSSLESNMPNYEHAGKNSNQEVLIPPLVARIQMKLLTILI